jgi:hypothetical protein
MERLSVRDAVRDGYASLHSADSPGEMQHWIESPALLEKNCTKVIDSEK